MNRQELLDMYSDYLVSAFGQTTGAALLGILLMIGAVALGVRTLRRQA